MKFWKTSITLATTILAATMVFSNQGENRKLLPLVPIYKVSPKHPDDLYARAIEGEAVIAVTVDIFGGATKPKVETATHPDLGIAASQAASEWIFEPATKDGVPIESRHLFSLRYRNGPIHRRSGHWENLAPWIKLPSPESRLIACDSLLRLFR